MHKEKDLQVVENPSNKILIEDFELDAVVFSKIADAVPDMIYVTDIQQMRKIYTNAAIHHLFGLNQNQIEQLGLRFFEKTIHPADQEMYFKSLERLKYLEDDELDELTYRVIDKNGNTHWIATRRKLLKRDYLGIPLQIVGISQNITPQLELQQEKQRLIDEQAKAEVVQQQLLFKAIIDAQEEERRNIAENLHNEIGQLLFAAQLKLGVEETESRALLQKAIKKVREVSFELTPVLLSDMGLEEALKDLLERKLDPHHISFNLSFTIKEFRLNRNLEVIVYRIIQELLNNTLKHAKATHVNVLIMQKDDELYVSKTDNGLGLDKNILLDTKKGFGLKSIVNRIHILNGVFEIFSSPDKGTKVLMNIPLNGAE
ncbi:sensor histidine kinase [Pedobacter sp.]